MAKVKRKNPLLQSKPDLKALSALAAKRIDLPAVPMTFDYQDDVDTLCIHFQQPVSPALVNEDDEQEKGIIGIYDGKKLVGVEILDISGQLEYADPR